MTAVRLNPVFRAMWKVHPLEGSEHEGVFDRFVDSDPAYGEYPERTTREIPVFELRPEGS
jgi:hypothetical protein